MLIYRRVSSYMYISISHAFQFIYISLRDRYSWGYTDIVYIFGASMREKTRRRHCRRADKALLIARPCDEITRYKVIPRAYRRVSVYMC